MQKILSIETTKQKKDILLIKIENEEMKPSIFVDDLILYLEDLTEATRILLDLITKVKLQDMKSILKRN